MWAAAGMIMQGCTTNQSALDNLLVVSWQISVVEFSSTRTLTSAGSSRSGVRAKEG